MLRRSRKHGPDFTRTTLDSLPAFAGTKGRGNDVKSIGRDRQSISLYSAPDFERVDRFAHIVGPNDFRAARDRSQRGCDAACRTLAGVAAGERADGRLTRQSDHDRIAQRDDLGKPSQQSEIMFHRLAKAKARIDNDAVAGYTGGLACDGAVG